MALQHPAILRTIANGQSLVQLVTDLLDACSNASSAASAVPRDQRRGSSCDSMEYVPLFEVFRNSQALGAMQRVLGRGDCFGLLLGYGNGPSWATGQVSWPPVSCGLCAVIFVHRVCSLCLPDLNPWTCLHTCMHKVQLLVVSAGRLPWHLTMLLSPPGPTCVQCESCQRCCSAPECSPAVLLPVEQCTMAAALSLPMTCLMQQIENELMRYSRPCMHHLTMIDLCRCALEEKPFQTSYTHTLLTQNRRLYLILTCLAKSWSAHVVSTWHHGRSQMRLTVPGHWQLHTAALRPSCCSTLAAGTFHWRCPSLPQRSLLGVGSP